MPPSDPTPPAAASDAAPPQIVVMAFAEVSASVLFGLYDLLHAPGRDWPLVVEGRPGESQLRPCIASVDGRPLRVANGVHVVPEAALHAHPTPAVAIVPEVFVAPGEDLEGRFDAEIAWLRRVHDSGAIVAAACSGALLLAEAGLLEGQEATTHWAYCDALVARHPGIRLQRQRALVAAGSGQRLVMAGGGTSWQDLGLYLIGRLLGMEAAMQVARVYLIDWHQAGQQPFARLSASRQADDAVVTRCQLWAAEHYASRHPVAGMLQQSGLSERSFMRRFRQATGLAPLQYVHTLRLEEAKQMLEATDWPVEAVAEQVGYEDAGYFARLFKRTVALTPAQYRRRFAGLREVLQQAGPKLPALTAARAPSAARR
jgi:transcriptional regulator GlxA family with amidase domain